LKMAPRHEYDLRATSLIPSYELADNIKPLTVQFEDDELVAPHEDGDVTLDKLKEFVFVEEDEALDPEYSEEEISGESDDSLEYESENEAPREYNLRAPASSSYEVADDLKPVTVKFEWDQLIVPHEEGDVTLDKLKEFVFEDDDEDEDPEYEYAVSSAESEASLDYEFESVTELESAEEDDVDSELESAEDDVMTSYDALASVVTKSCFDLVDNEDVNWSSANRAEEYIASFGVSQFGIRFVDTGLSVVETPISLVSTWLAGSVRSTRRHLRAARRAGEKQNADSCKSMSLLVHMANLFPFNAVLGTLGVGLVDENSSKTDVVDEDIDDPEYIVSSDETEDSLEFRSEIESDVDSEITESSDGEEEFAEVIASSDMEVVSE